VSSVFHGTHFDKLKEICTGDYAILKGNSKQWRFLDYKDFREGYCSYYVEQDQLPQPMTEILSKFNFGPVVWFSTNKGESDLYGPCQFELSINSALQAYQRTRGKKHKICYRAAGTLVYKGEVNHVVLICCEEDDNLKSFPLITDNNTKYFKPPFESCNDFQDHPTEKIFQVKINDYHKKLKYIQKRVDYERHEHISIAMYLPQSRKLLFDKKNAKLTSTSHKRYCIQSRKKECRFEKTIVSINQLIQLAPWIAPQATAQPISNSDCQGYTKQNPISFEEPSSHKQVEKVADIEDGSEWFIDANYTWMCDYQIKGSCWKGEQPSIEGSQNEQCSQIYEESFDWLSDIDDADCCLVNDDSATVKKRRVM